MIRTHAWKSSPNRRLQISQDTRDTSDAIKHYTFRVCLELLTTLLQPLYVVNTDSLLPYDLSMLAGHSYQKNTICDSL